MRAEAVPSSPGMFGTRSSLFGLTNGLVLFTLPFMRSTQRTVRRDAMIIAVTTGLVGATFGAVATTSGAPWWATVALSLAVFGGAAQFLLVSLLPAGAALPAAVLAALVVNARLVPLGFAAAPFLPPGRWRWVAAHVITDETVAFARAAGSAEAFRDLGTRLFLCWNIGTIAGVMAAQGVTDSRLLGLDAAFPAALLALVLPSLRDPVTRRTALAGCVLAVATTPLLPAGLPVLASLLAVLPAMLRARGATAGDTGS